MEVVVRVVVGEQKERVVQQGEVEKNWIRRVLEGLYRTTVLILAQRVQQLVRPVSIPQELEEDLDVMAQREMKRDLQMVR